MTETRGVKKKFSTKPCRDVGMVPLIDQVAAWQKQLVVDV